VKPLEYGKFLKAIARVFKLYESDKNQHLSTDYIFIKEDGVLSKVMQKDIVCCEALGDYVKVHLKGKTHTVYSTMKNMEDKLKNNKQFIRVHRSFIINLDFLENFDAETSVVAGRVIPIGNKYKSDLQSKLNII
jgi:DNA-binding LytR/AlgR family response regulator